VIPGNLGNVTQQFSFKKIFSLNQIPVAEEGVGIKSDKNRELPTRSCENFASLQLWPKSFKENRKKAQEIKESRKSK
jgi:hypothetical protein